MAASATMQSYVAGLVPPRFGTRSHSVGLPATHSVPRRHAAGVMRVQCQAKKQPTPVTPPPPKAKVSTNFTDVLAFGGPAPERINGRLAMVGFVAALAVEAARGDGLLAQVDNGGLLWFVGTAAVLSAASLVPLFKGVSPQSKSDGLMTADAELWNGRFAMVGIVALAFTEYLTGGPLV